MTRLRLAVSGAGRAFERLYLPAIATSPDFDLVGVADPRLERFAAVPGSAARAGSAAELLERTKPDALMVLSPPERHAADAIAAMDRTVPVLVEKPMCQTGAEVESLRGAGAERLLTPALTRRYWPVYRAIAARGPAWDIAIRLRSDPAAWEAVDAASGPLDDLAPHVIDLARYLSGSPIGEVLAERHARGVALAFSMESGAAARIILEWPGEYREAIRADGKARRAGPPSAAASLLRRVARRPDPPVAAIGHMLADWARHLRGDLTVALPAFEDGAAAVATVQRIRERLG